MSLCWASPPAYVIERVSVSSSGAEGNGDSGGPAISRDGRFVAFYSTATNLVAGDTNGRYDVLVHDRQTGLTTRVSVDSAGGEGNGDSGAPCISADGRFVAFQSTATNLAAGDTNGRYDVFVHDRQTGLTTRVSVDSGGGEGNGDSGAPCISADGRFVAFCSGATNLVADDRNGNTDVFLHDRVTQQLERLSDVQRGWAAQPCLSMDGSMVAWEHAWWEHDWYDYWTESVLTTLDRRTGKQTEFSFAYWHSALTLSGNGRYLTYIPTTQIYTGDYENVDLGVYVRELQTGQTTAIDLNVDRDPDIHYYSAAIADDERLIAYSKDDYGTHYAAQAYVCQRETGTKVLVSSNAAGEPGIGPSPSVAIAGNARVVALGSYARNLVPGDTNGRQDVFISTYAPLSFPPTLSWAGTSGHKRDGVAPNRGKPDNTDFGFKVKMQDPDGDDPDYVRLLLRKDGEKWRSFTLEAGPEPITDGRTYSISLKLPFGSYSHRFRARDIDGFATGEASEWADGPYVEPPPELSWLGTSGYEADGVDPDQGAGGDMRFRFKVLYSDADGHEPRYVSLHLRRNGKPFWEFTMVRGVGDYTSGREYRRTRKLPPGNYEHCFKARDRDGLATGEATQWTPGPVVGPRTTVALTSLSAVPTNAGTQITFSLSSAAQVQARILNIAGRPIKTLCRAKDCEAGTNTLLWNAMSDQGLAVPNGTYLVEVTAKAADGPQARALAQVRLSR